VAISLRRDILSEQHLTQLGAAHAGCLRLTPGACCAGTKQASGAVAPWLAEGFGVPHLLLGPEGVVGHNLEGNDEASPRAGGHCGRAWMPGCFPRCLDRRLQLGLLCCAEGGGEPPLCSKASPAGPLCRKSSTQSPMVWTTRPNASDTWAADQLRASNQSACQRSRSRGVRARYTPSRSARTSNCQRSSTASVLARRIIPMSFIAEPYSSLFSPTVYHTGSADFILESV